MNDFRALCAELVTAWENGDDIVGAINRARAALAEEAGVGPTLEQVENLCEEHEFGVEGYESVECLQGLINDALARYGTHPRPIPVAERLPTAADCDDKGRCWFLYRIGGTGWDLIDRAEVTGPAIWCCWLPAAAIPLPEVEP